MTEALRQGLKVFPDNIRIIGENGTATIKNLAHALKVFSRMLNLEDSIESFVGTGTAVLASSSADELSRLGPGGHYSLFTGIVSTAFLSKQLIRKGKISLESIVEYIRILMDMWNLQHPDLSQQPIIRTSIGGMIYFDVENYCPYETKQVVFETSKYRVCSVKPLSSSREKRLCAFVIPKFDDYNEQIPSMTKEIAKKFVMKMYFPAKKVNCFSEMNRPKQSGVILEKTKVILLIIFIMHIVYGSVIGKQRKNIFAQIVTANGRSYSDPVYNTNGSVNMDASRRVEFKFRLQKKIRLKRFWNIRKS